MDFAIKPDGADRGYFDVVPSTHIRCAPRPSVDHVPADNWRDDPMNPAVCWRAKTAPELAAEQETGHRRDFSGREDTLLNLLFTAANDIRVLKGLPPISKATFWTYVKNLHVNDNFFDGTF